MPRALLATFLLLSVVGILAPAVVSSSEPDAKSKTDGCASEQGLGKHMAKRIQRRYDGIRDLRARFEQTSESATFGGTPLMTAEKKQGHVVFAKPGRMRWSYEEPERSEVVSNGTTLWIYDVEARSATRLAVTAGFLSGAALQFLLGDGKILESFEVEVRDCDAERVTLDLVPRREASYERLGLVADRDSGDVVATSVLDLFGNLTRIRFEQIEVNLGPEREIFELSVPEGVEIIEYEAVPGG